MCIDCTSGETHHVVERPQTIVACSGGFDPLHVGHLRLFKAARELGDKLVVILNSDEFLMKKKGNVFMPFSERKELLEGVRYVDEVIGSIDKDMSVCETLKMIKPTIFANGGDRETERDIPEAEVCRSLGIKMVFGVGGGKIQSSSRLVERAKNLSKRSGSQGEKKR